MKASYAGCCFAAIWSRLVTSGMRAMEPPGRWTVARLYSLTMTRHFGVLIPSTNTTVEMECRLLPATYQAHVGRLMSSGGGGFSPSRNEGIEYQQRLLRTAKVEIVILPPPSPR